jgi:hypothetical protein
VLRVVAALVCAALSSCDCAPPVLACTSSHDCPPDLTCLAGACLANTAIGVDGGTNVGGEGEGASGEGERGTGEGEGAASGEGEGATSGEGEGEGATSGEGEGEGATSGEGEGEGATSGEGEGANAGEGEGEGALPSSCAQILADNSSAPSGTYALDVGGASVNVECDMVTSGGGWALLVRYDEGESCPSPWIPSARGCVRVTDAAESSVLVTPPFSFREMRGTVRALGFGVAEAFRDDGGKTIDDTYVDGMSITVGTPRNHVFTFALGKTDSFNGDSTGVCPCDGGTPSPSFVGASYLCEEPAESCDPVNSATRFFDDTDVLFDGQDIQEAVCLNVPESAPDFQVDLGVVHGEDVELRMIFDEASNNEDLAVIHMDLWVR